MGCRRLLGDLIFYVEPKYDLSIMTHLDVAATMSQYISLSKRKSKAFIRDILIYRGYKRPSEPRYYAPERLWEMETVDSRGQKVLAAFTNVCKPIGDVMEIEEVSNDQTSSESVPELSTSAQFVQNLLKYARKRDYKIIILVSDNIPHQAYKLIAGATDIQITHFTYRETCLGAVHRHYSQPLEIVKADPPRKDECKPIAVWDMMMRIHGFQVGDLLRVTEADRQTGVSVQYIKVVA